MCLCLRIGTNACGYDFEPREKVLWQALWQKQSDHKNVSLFSCSAGSDALLAYSSLENVHRFLTFILTIRSYLKYLALLSCNFFSLSISVSLSFSCVSSFFTREAWSTPVYVHSGCPLANEHRTSLFPNRAFCTFNHVTLSRPDYRRLSSLEKVRAGIRASWGIRSPNWFQLCLPSNDQFFSPADGAAAHTLREGSFFICFGTSKGLHAGHV